MKSKLSPIAIILIIATSLSALSFLLLWNEVSGLDEGDIMFHYPITRLETLIFLSQPLLMFAPFLIAITIIGSYFLTRFWMRDVVINVVTETYNKTLNVNRTKHLTDDEKVILKILIENKSEMVQSDLVKESKLPKHKITRILDRMENYEIVSREKYGITNIIRLNCEVESIDNS